RRRDSTLPLFCIPHGGAMDRIRSLRRILGFEMLEDGIDRLDAFAEQLFPDPGSAPYRGNLRKYAALTLPFEEVAYFDIDTGMLIEPRRLFGHIRPGEADLIYMSTSPGWVYAPEKIAGCKTAVRRSAFDVGGRVRHLATGADNRAAHRDHRVLSRIIPSLAA